MCELLKLSEKTIILYIKQLYHFIPNKINRTNITKDMITDISSSKELLPIIKTLQAFTIDERILYITLKLLIRKKIILTNSIQNQKRHLAICKLDRLFNAILTVYAIFNKLIFKPHNFKSKRDSTFVLSLYFF